MNRLALVVVLSLLTLACGDRSDGSGGPDSGQPIQGSVTWYRDVLPLVQENCQGCHVAGGIAPFALQSYEVAFSYHPMIASAVATRQMPPWPADDSCVAIKNSRRLTDAEVDVFAHWSAAGAPAGDPADAPPPRAPAPGLAWVDATLDPGFDYVPTVTTDHPTDDYHCFVLPPAFTTQKDLIGFEVLPGTPHQVHHVILFAVPESQTTTPNSSGLGWTCYGGPGVSNFRMVGGWAPGSGATPFPPGTGIRAAAGEVLVMQVHYNTSHALAVADRTKVRLQFAREPVISAWIVPIINEEFLNREFAIAPNIMNQTSSHDEALPALAFSARLWGVTPHMHELGRRIRVQNVTTQQCLIDVPNWDFHWQQSYEYATPLVVRGGDTIRIECTWDNPTSSTVYWGEGTADEMCVAFFYGTIP